MISKLVEGCDELAIKLVIADGFNLARKILSDIKLVTAWNDCDAYRVEVWPKDILRRLSCSCWQPELVTRFRAPQLITFETPISFLLADVLAPIGILRGIYEANFER